MPYERINVSEGNDLNGDGISRESIVCIVCGTFLDMNARFQSKLCGGCHNLMMKAMSFNETVIAKVKNYRIFFFWYGSR